MASRLTLKAKHRTVFAVTTCSFLSYTPATACRACIDREYSHRTIDVRRIIATLQPVGAIGFDATRQSKTARIAIDSCTLATGKRSEHRSYKHGSYD